MHSRLNPSRTPGLQFAAALPSDGREHVLNLRCAMNALSVAAIHPQMRTLELVVPAKAQTDRWCLEVGPGLAHVAVYKTRGRRIPRRATSCKISAVDSLIGSWVTDAPHCVKDRVESAHLHH